MWESVMAISTEVGILPERLTLHDFGSAEFASGVEALFEPPAVVQVEPQPAGSSQRDGFSAPCGTQ